MISRVVNIKVQKYVQVSYKKVMKIFSFVRLDNLFTYQIYIFQSLKKILRNFPKTFFRKRDNDERIIDTNYQLNKYTYDLLRY